jgi:hypothetical protein
VLGLDVLFERAVESDEELKNLAYFLMGEDACLRFEGCPCVRDFVAEVAREFDEGARSCVANQVAYWLGESVDEQAVIRLFVDSLSKFTALMDALDKADILKFAEAILAYAEEPDEFLSIRQELWREYLEGLKPELLEEIDVEKCKEESNGE